MSDNIDDDHAPNVGAAVSLTVGRFGGCPACGGEDGYVNRGMDHWFLCDKHRTRWWAGSNLFSSCHSELSESEKGRLMEVMAYRVVEPLPASIDADQP